VLHVEDVTYIVMWLVL